MSRLFAPPLAHLVLEIVVMDFLAQLRQTGSEFGVVDDGTKGIVGCGFRVIGERLGMNRPIVSCSWSFRFWPILSAGTSASQLHGATFGFLPQAPRSKGKHKVYCSTDKLPEPNI